MGAIVNSYQVANPIHHHITLHCLPAEEAVSISNHYRAFVLVLLDQLAAGLAWHDICPSSNGREKILGWPSYTNPIYPSTGGHWWPTGFAYCRSLGGTIVAKNSDEDC